MTQTNYQDMSTAHISVKGGLADAGFTNKVSRASEAVIGFGLAVVRLSTGFVAMPSEASQVFEGVTIMKHLPRQNVDGLAQYAIGAAISVLRKGRIWVYSEVAVNPTLDVYFRFTANTGPTRIVGDFLTSADSAKADLVANAKWVSVTTAAGLAILELNLP